MASLVLQAEKRIETGKNAANRLRAVGRIPAVIYGKKIPSVSLSVDPSDVISILESDSGRNTIFTVDVAKETTQVLIRDFQLDPIRGTLVHVDFQSVSIDQIMQFQVPIEAEGSSEGVKQGGILDIVLREVEVECEAGIVPDQIAVDVSELEIGDSVRIADLVIDERVKVLSDPGLVVLAVVPPRVEEEEAEVEEEEEGLPEPEVIVKGKGESEGEE